MLLGLLLMGLCGAGEWQINTDLFEEIPSRVSFPTVGPDGHVYFLDSKEGRVYHLNEAGEMVIVFGSKGEGPGEFAYPYRMAVSYSENLIYIVDSQSPQMMVFTPAGKPLEPRIEVERRTYPDLLLDGKSLVIRTQDPFVKPNQGAEVAVALGEGKSQTIASFTAEQHQDPATAGDKDAAQAVFGFPWHRKVLVCVSPDGKYFYISPNNTLKAAVYDSATLKLIGTIEDDRLVKPPLLKEEIEENPTTVNLNGKKYTADDFENPEYKPALTEIMADERGRLWVRLSPFWKAEVNRFRIYGKDGKLAGTLETPMGTDIFHADEAFIWCTVTNEAGDTLIAKKAYELKTP